MTERAFSVLVVEDDDNDRFLFRRAFARAGPRAALTLVPDAPAAKRCLSGCDRPESRNALPDLALFDVKLPGESGLELLGWVRSARKLRSLPVVMFTSSLERKDMERAYELGANSYIVKPSGFDALFRVLDKMIDYWCNLNRNPESEKT